MALKLVSKELQPPSLEQYQNPQGDQFVKVVESYGDLNNYYRHVEISCQTQASKDIFISFEAVKNALESDWFRKDLTKSFSCSKRLDVCAHECGKTFNSTGSQYI